jgi:hypothetical protein
VTGKVTDPILIQCEEWPPSGDLLGFQLCAAMTEGLQIVFLPPQAILEGASL